MSVTTEQVRKPKTQRKSAPRWNLAQAQLDAASRGQAVIEFELDGTILTANDNFLRAMGYSLDEVQGRHHRMFVDSATAESAEYRDLWRRLGEGQTVTNEFRRFGKDGKEVWIQASYAPVFDKSGAPVRVIKFATDVTDGVRKREEAHRLRRIIEDSDAAFMMIDRDFVVTYVNRATIDLLTKHSEILRTVWPTFEVNNIVGTCIDQFHKNPAHQRRMLSDPSILPYKTDIKVGPLTMALIVTAVYDSAGEYVGNTLEWQDVTEKRAQEVRDADFRGQLAAIDKSQAVISFKPDGTIIEANENFLATVGYALDEIQGKHHRQLIDPTEAQSVEYRQFWADLADKKFQSSQYKLIGKTGQEVWIQGSYNPIVDLSGEVYKIVAYASEITAAKQMEFEIAEKAERDRVLAEEQAQKVTTILEIVNAVADGNFAVDFPDLGADSVGQVSTALEQAVLAVRNALVQVREVSTTVATAAQQLNAVSREITDGAQTQASSLEETASSLEEITATVRQNTDNAQQARQLATGSRDVAENGGDVVNGAVTAMDEINQSSKQIADIITTIDEIAFQTNLLALNAAVEAARAGEQGRGFAVVAAEVRNLAQRSASAAKEIKSLIQDSVGKVENGTSLVNKSGETLSEIVNSVKRVTDIVSEIAAASQEQLTGIEQVNKAVSQMDRVTQSNASQTEEMSGTANALLSHATQLSELVNRFNLGVESQSQPRAAAPVVAEAAASRGGSPAPAMSFDMPASDADMTLEF